MCNARIVLCEACSSEGRLYRGDPEAGWSEPCPYCEGTGGELIETQPIELEDLEAKCGEETEVNADAKLKRGAQIIWAMAGPVADEKYWEEIWEYETRPERVAQVGEWWPITAARQIMALQDQS